MSDPFRIFAAGRSKQETLKVIWPALYECLARLDKPSAPRVLHCVIGACSVAKPRRPALGRLTPNGHPACVEHLRTCERPGGWPLKRMSETS